MERTKGAERSRVMDEACKRAWAKRHASLKIIRREMYARQRDAAFARSKTRLLP